MITENEKEGSLQKKTTTRKAIGRIFYPSLSKWANQIFSLLVYEKKTIEAKDKRRRAEVVSKY